MKSCIRLYSLLLAGLCVTLAAVVVPAQEKNEARHDADTRALTAAPPTDSTTEGSVTVGGQAIAYRAVAGTLTVGSTDVQDAMIGLDGKYLPDSGIDLPAKPEDQPASARLFYAAYFKKGATASTRPITFLYNGGPGSATMYLHMGAFGPRRLVVPDAEHKEAAPYALVENQYSLLDASDLVFIDAPGTGFSRVLGKDAGKSFWGIDEDGHAFDRFIRRFLTNWRVTSSPEDHVRFRVRRRLDSSVARSIH